MRWLLGFAVAVLVAGCLEQAAPLTKGPAGAVLAPADWAARALVQADEHHSHRDWRAHRNLTSPNFVELGHDPLGIPAFGNVSAGGYFCGGEATTAEGRKLTVISSFDTSVAFVVVDTTNPAHPKFLGDYVLDHAQTYDVDLTPDGRHVVVAADPSPNAQRAPPGSAAPVHIGLTFRDACTGATYRAPGETVAAGPSTILVSIADPTKPAFEDIVPSPVLGPHSVSSQTIGGVTYVASSITNLVHHASYFQFFELASTPLGTKLQPIALVDAGLWGEVAEVNGHVDAEIEMHPVTHKPVVYLSDWDGGFVILDFSNPAAPLKLGAWHDTGPDGGALHSTFAVPGVHNGHHYVLAGQEFVGHPSNRPSGWVYVLDDTDPTNVHEVGRWTLPVDTQLDWTTESPGKGAVELFSTHYFRIAGETVFVAMYHGGLWAFHLDLDHPDAMKEPPTVGVFVPDQPGQKGREPKGGYDYTPFVLDVFPMSERSVVTYDGLSGVYSLTFDPTMSLPSIKPWPASGAAS